MTVRVLGVVAGPEPGGRTAAAVAGVLAGAEKAGATTSLLELSEAGVEAVVAALDAADAVVFGSPSTGPPTARC
jgi:FMN reductase